MKKILFLVSIISIIYVFCLAETAKAGTEHNVWGWAWSENIGWISFNSINCDVPSGPRPAGCPAGSIPSYGVNIDLYGYLSGYAWSENIGWISFDRAKTSNPPAAPFQSGSGPIARVDLDGTVCGAVGKVCGWARALSACQDNLWDSTNLNCTGSGAGNRAGGWDGWINLQGFTAEATPNGYGISIDFSSSPADFLGWTWGDSISGWINFHTIEAEAVVLKLDEGSSQCTGLGCHSLTSLELDSNGYPVIAYYIDIGTAGYIKLIHCNDPNCIGNDEAVNIVTNQTGDWRNYELENWSVDLELDSNGYPVIAYHKWTPSEDLMLARCNDPNCAGGDETITTVDSTDDVGSWGLSMKLDGSGFPVISYWRDGGGRALKFVHCNDLNCVSETPIVMEAGDIGAGGSLAIDSAGRPVIAYGNSTISKVIHCNDPNCTLPETINELRNSSGQSCSITGASSLQLDPNTGNPVIACKRDGLVLFRCNDVNCAGGNETDVSIVPGSFGSFSSLALDGRIPVIAYRVETAAGGDIGLARCNDYTCGSFQTNVIDNPYYNVGRGISMKLDNFKWPVISYWDLSSHDLKFAHCDDLGCNPSNISDYRVRTSFVPNALPRAEDLSVDPHNPADYCGISAYPPVRVNWNFSDDDPGDTQSAYEIEVFRISDGSKVVDTGKKLGDTEEYVFSQPGEQLSWGQSYAWNIMVWDNKDAPSAPANGPQIDDEIPLHAYPSPSFTPYPTQSFVGSLVLFTDTSKCYSVGSTVTSCDVGTFSYLWDFGAGANPGSSFVKTFTTTTYSSAGVKEVNLEITDSSISPPAVCDVTRTVNISIALPKWREIPPIILLERALAMISSFIEF